MSDLEALKTQLADWNHRLNERDEHSIGKQIAHMLSRSAFYRSLNESRRFLPDEKDGNKRANGVLHELIDEGYITVNSTAIRRLIDRSATTGPRGVYSLHGLIRDIKANMKLITRSNILAARGLEYDFEPIRERAIETARREAREKGHQAFGISRDGWQMAEYWHNTMDKLCNVTSSNRDRYDSPEENKLRTLLEELEDRGRNVQDWVDKYVAHASSKESRQTLPLEHRSLSLAKLWLAERAVVRAANFISYSFVDGTNLGGVPIPQFDQFAHLDQPFVQTNALPAMHSEWAQHCAEIQNWSWDSPLTDASDVWPDEVESKGD